MNFRRIADLFLPALGEVFRIMAWTFAEGESAAAGATPPDCFDKDSPATKVAFRTYENMVLRMVEFDVPKQDNGNLLTIGLLPVPVDTPDGKTTHRETKTKSGKYYPNGNDFLTWVINPIVVNSDGTPQTEFNPPIRMVVTIDDKDYETSKAAGHDGRITIVAAYVNDNRWNYKILDTAQEGKTLTACLDNLNPNDPLGLGHP